MAAPGASSAWDINSTNVPIRYAQNSYSYPSDGTFGHIQKPQLASSAFPHHTNAQFANPFAHYRDNIDASPVKSKRQHCSTPQHLAQVQRHIPSQSQKAAQKASKQSVRVSGRVTKTQKKTSPNARSSTRTHRRKILWDNNAPALMVIWMQHLIEANGLPFPWKELELKLGKIYNVDVPSETALTRFMKKIYEALEGTNVELPPKASKGRKPKTVAGTVDAKTANPALTGVPITGIRGRAPKSTYCLPLTDSAEHPSHGMSNSDNFSGMNEIRSTNTGHSCQAQQPGSWCPPGMPPLEGEYTEEDRDTESEPESEPDFASVPVTHVAPHVAGMAALLNPIQDNQSYLMPQFDQSTLAAHYTPFGHHSFMIDATAGVTDVPQQTASMEQQHLGGYSGYQMTSRDFSQAVDPLGNLHSPVEQFQSPDETGEFGAACYADHYPPIWQDFEGAAADFTMSAGLKTDNNAFELDTSNLSDSKGKVAQQQLFSMDPNDDLASNPAFQNDPFAQNNDISSSLQLFSSQRAGLCSKRGVELAGDQRADMNLSQTFGIDSNSHGSADHGPQADQDCAMGGLSQPVSSDMTGMAEVDVSSDAITPLQISLLNTGHDEPGIPTRAIFDDTDEAWTLLRNNSLSSGLDAVHSGDPFNMENGYEHASYGEFSFI